MKKRLEQAFGHRFEQLVDICQAGNSFVHIRALKFHHRELKSRVQSLFPKLESRFGNCLIEKMNRLSTREPQPDEAEPVAGEQEEEQHKPFVRPDRKIGRNEPCPCGSGKKYKQCHGKLS